MTKEQIDILVGQGEFPEAACRPELIETHISWVLICTRYVYKIKKPVRYPFLDFSTLEKRKYFCEKEIRLNKRLTDHIYIDVQPVTEAQGHLAIGKQEGSIIDYAVCMHKVDRSRQMDVLLLKGAVTKADLRDLARKVAYFHKTTGLIRQKDLMDIPRKFNDLKDEIPWLQQQPGSTAGAVISHAIKFSGSFMEQHRHLLQSRQQAGLFRDCHGDLHSKNIFLLDTPQPFDCIEFNDDFRQIDVLNEVAFLCMDLDAFGRHDLSDLFLEYYNDFFATVKTADDYRLFIYYKSYRANVRAKVNSLRARSAVDKAVRAAALTETNKYLALMAHYVSLLTTGCAHTSDKEQLPF